MGTLSEVSLAHHRDIFHYYVSLKTFFEVTGENRDRSNSTRAQKARAKLLKLSSSQFYELSTDVSDELQRRIGEDANQPDYLLPKANFHMKRNQARQKLANLSQTRFNDLLDDILFEIKRRGFDKDLDAPAPTPAPAPQAPPLRATRQEVVKGGHDFVKTSANSSSVAQVAPNVSVQPSLVIPKMASIDWSSEEEEEEEAKPKFLKSKEPEEEKVSKDEKREAKPSLECIVTDSAVSDSQELVHDIASMARTPTMTQKNYWDVNDSPIIKVDNDVSEDKYIEQMESPDLQRLENGDSDSNMKDKMKELTDLNGDLYSQIEDLNTRLASLASEREKEKDLKNNHTIDGNFQKELLSLNSQIGELSIENENLKQKISELELSQRKSGNHNDPKITDSFIIKYSSVEGLIPVEYISNARNLIIQFTTRLSALPTSDSTVISHRMGKELFQILSQLSNLISQLLLSADLLQYKDQVILLKASLSHAITSIRYFSVYGPALVPKITVQAAVSEISFAICNLVDSAKIKSDSNFINMSGNETNGQTIEYSPPTTTTPMTPTFPTSSSSSINMKKAFINPRESVSFLNDVEEEESPVKPLKITQKAINSPIIRPSSANGVPTASRKPSGTGLFTLMMDSSNAKNNSHKDDNDKYVSPIKSITSASDSASSNISEIPKLTLPPQSNVSVTPSENRVPDIKVENIEKEEKEISTNITTPTSAISNSDIADKLKQLERKSENSEPSEQVNSKPKLSNKFISSMNEVSTDDDSSTDGNGNNYVDDDDDDDFTYMALKQTMKREGSKSEKKKNSDLPARIIEIDFNESPESVKIESPESMKFQSPELIKRVVSPETTKKTTFSAFSKDIECPEMTKITSPETIKKVASSELTRTSGSPEFVEVIESPELTKKFESPELLEKNASPEMTKRPVAERTEFPEMTKRPGSPEMMKNIAFLEMTKKSAPPVSIEKMASSVQEMTYPVSGEKTASLKSFEKTASPVEKMTSLKSFEKTASPVEKMTSPVSVEKIVYPVEKMASLKSFEKTASPVEKMASPVSAEKIASPISVGKTESLKSFEKTASPVEKMTSPASVEKIVYPVEKMASLKSFEKTASPVGKTASPVLVENIKSPEMTKNKESPEVVKKKAMSSEVVMKVESPNMTRKIERSESIMEVESPNMTRKTTSPEVIKAIEPPKVLKKIVFPKAIRKTEPPGLVGEIVSSETSRRNELPKANNLAVSPEATDAPPLEAMEETVELPHVKATSLNKLAGLNAEGMGLNTLKTDVGPNLAIKQEEDDDKDFNKVPDDYVAKSITQPHTAHGNIDFNRLPNGHKTGTGAQIHNAEEKHDFVDPIKSAHVKKANYLSSSKDKLVNGGNSKVNGGALNGVRVVRNIPETMAHEEEHDSDDDSSYQFVPMKHRGQEQDQVETDESEEDEDEDDDEDDDEEEGSDFDVDTFDIENPDNTLSELLLYLEHQTMDVISTIQSLLTSIKKPQVTKGNLRGESNAINQVIGQMVDATSISMQQSRNANLKKHGDWVVQSLRDCSRRMTILCQLNSDGGLTKDRSDEDYADKNFKQRLAGIAFDVAKCTKELVKTVEEASLKDEISYLNSRLK
ncbi:Spa2p SKDI_12G0360 [Saccharomyces kudriavzevii IFO 1802]|uniref:Uncharacterized protein n=2 Tax=Saccharomyces kudriavzevii (strain ATCC MYA-4449 / AS 2.2408 / CBS 8840 / NBRC 1802 / NCYC 2889) TaxID=226230 RepID=A0AA35J1T9_SACK1|nr:uncharacterized protein SKDI_12G0360 [Saccharomyces kudriavzevii IFO 1802]EJT41976.1 SPA2-like protein [Saccharomyces kudriavzevii IFO 1802]CAI4045643.1 hypothetical protein SKDI_12G0360 [Saccharomyces kudriavzevii IFO 1802]